MKTLVFCSGSTNRGLGHIKRSYSFSKRIAPHHEVVLMVRADEYLIPMSHGTLRVMKALTDQDVFDYCQEWKPEVVFFDTLDVNQRVFDDINRHFLTASLSPISTVNSTVDLVFSRVALNESIAGQLFHGLEFALFSDDCERISTDDYTKNVNNSVPSIGISMGGTDAPNKTLSVLKELSRMECQATFWVMLGEGYLHSYDELARLSTLDARHEIILAKTTRSMWKILSQCSLLLMSGGVSLLEAVNAGIPAIHLFEKEDHRSLIPEAIRSKNVLIDGGVFGEQAMPSLNACVESLLNDRTQLETMHQNTEGILSTRAPELILELVVRHLHIKGEST